MATNDRDFALTEEEQFGEWVYEQFASDIVIETQGWAFDLVQQVAKRLNQQRQNLPRLEPVVIWISQVTAFVVPGRYVYISRELLQRFLYEDALALVLAHEFAHHDLGHVQLFTPSLSLLKHLPGGTHVALSLRGAEQLLFSPEREQEADRYGLELCLAAGYNGDRCLELFDVLEAHLLDHGDLEGVFDREELEDTSARKSEGFAQWFEQVWDWTNQRVRRYPAIHKRKQALMTQLLERCDRSQTNRD